MSDSPIEIVADQRAFDALLGDLDGVAELAIDTEFHRERTYFAQLALVQLGFEGRIVVVDPLNVDIADLGRVLDSDTLVIMHACRQDLEIMERACGAAPRHLVDTQLAAGFLGYTSPSLASMVEKELGHRLPKADRLTDWLRRPLSDAQLRYAGSDVAYLGEIWHSFSDRLGERSRMEWFDAAMNELLAESRGPRDPADSWRRIKELRHLRNVDLAVARAVAAWRESRAIELDITPRYILSDLGVVGVAVSKPNSIDDLRSIRGVDGRAMKATVANDLIAIVADAVANPVRFERQANLPELSAELRPALPLVSAWATQVARDLEIELSLLATRSDLEALLRGDPDARLAVGWRSAAVGESIRRLLAGEAAIAFDRGGGLSLEPRSP